MKTSILPPTTEKELLARVSELAGFSIAEAARRMNIAVPLDLTRKKGWVGQLLEQCLGADAKNAPMPDFSKLGIELKTIPVNAKGTPIESTFVTVVPLISHLGLSWEASEIRQKLQRVLWIPIEGDSAITLAERKIGNGLLWSPSAEIEEILRKDWEELMNMVAMGELENITARMGKWLQIRPKAASGASLSWGIAEDGSRIMTLPRGFYLRAEFTKMILNNYYLK